MAYFKESLIGIEIVDFYHVQALIDMVEHHMQKY